MEMRRDLGGGKAIGDAGCTGASHHDA
jgi:hypothetical protein